ncbi:hypothetical protein KC353_g2 [Hortaea werneckii]|nr:hypothetical protein KC353_g2 [Hortaea werneckii]
MLIDDLSSGSMRDLHIEVGSECGPVHLQQLLLTVAQIRWRRSNGHPLERKKFSCGHLAKICLLDTIHCNSSRMKFRTMAS